MFLSVEAEKHTTWQWNKIAFHTQDMVQHHHDNNTQETIGRRPTYDIGGYSTYLIHLSTWC